MGEEILYGYTIDEFISYAKCKSLNPVIKYTEDPRRDKTKDYDIRLIKWNINGDTIEGLFTYLDFPTI